MIVDPEKVADDLTEQELGDLVAEVRADWKAAESTRAEREAVAIEDLELYHRERRDAKKQAEERGGTSTIEIPIVYWNIEHQVPRLGVDPPRVRTKAKRVEAVPYAMAKQMRIQHYMDTCGWEIPYQQVVRSKLVLGDGIAMIPWSPQIHSPRVVPLDWFDFFVSSEAATMEGAEWHFARTFWTKRGLENLIGDEAEYGEGPHKGKPIWVDLDEISSATRSALDSTFDRRREISHMGVPSGEDSGGGEMFPMLSCWNKDGSYVVLAGEGYDRIVRAQVTPYRRRVFSPDGKSTTLPVRPFVFFRNILDLTGPYSLSEPRSLGDHQIEMSTLRNIAIDQAAADLNSPIVHDDALDPDLVARAFSTPKGTLPVPWGANGPLIQRMPPGQLSSDLDRIYEQIRNEVQLISGINDNAAGQPVNTEQTATEVSILSQEANRRMQLKRRMDELAMAEVGKHFDWLDRQFGGEVMVDVEQGFDPGAAQGFIGPSRPSGSFDLGAAMAGQGGSSRAIDFSSGLARIDGAVVNAPSNDYEVTIEAGSATRAEQGEEVQKLNAFIAVASHPAIQPMISWDNVARQVLESFGLDPDRFFRPPPPPAPTVDANGQPIPELPPGVPATPVQ